MAYEFSSSDIILNYTHTQEVHTHERCTDAALEETLVRPARPDWHAPAFKAAHRSLDLASPVTTWQETSQNGGEVIRKKSATLLLLGLVWLYAH